MIRHVHISECDSTQDVIKEQLKREGTQHEMLVSCDDQRSGRGRNTNQWTTLPGSLCFSFTIKPHREISFTALEMSVLVTDFFEGSKLGLKWPNDIWNGSRKKCCGILVQSFQGVMVAGIGVNLWSNHPDFGGIYDSRFEFDKKSWAMEMAMYIKQNRYSDTQKLKAAWERKCWHIGSKVILTEGEVINEGFFQGIGPHGEAMIMTSQGLKHLYNGSLRVLSSDHSEFC